MRLLSTITLLTLLGVAPALADSFSFHTPSASNPPPTGSGTGNGGTGGGSSSGGSGSPGSGGQGGQGGAGGQGGQGGTGGAAGGSNSLGCVGLCVGTASGHGVNATNSNVGQGTQKAGSTVTGATGNFDPTIDITYQIQVIKQQD